MDDKVIQALGALIEERGAMLFQDAVPLLPEELLQRAISIAEGIEDSDLRTSVLASLAERLTDEEEQAHILKYIPPIPRFPSETRRLDIILLNVSDNERESFFEMLLHEISRLVQPKKRAKPPDRGAPVAMRGGGGGGSQGGTGGGARTSSQMKGGLRPSDIYVPRGGGRGGVHGAGAGAGAGGGGDFESTRGDFEAPIVAPGGGGGGGQGMYPRDALAGGGAPPPKKPSTAGAGTSESRRQTATRKRSDFVNLGFANRQAPDAPLDATETLECGKTYLFWLEVGEKLAGSIEEEPTSLGLDKLPAKSRLRVALFAFEGELEVVKGEDIGELQVITYEDGDGQQDWFDVEVAKQPMGTESARLGSQRLKSRLFFPVRVPERAGVFRLRCNIYCKQALVQSRLISVLAQSVPQKVNAAFFKREKALFADDSPLLKNKKALHSDRDFVLSRKLDPASLPRLPHRLSLMFNSNGNGTHSFLFGRKGDELYKADASFTEGELGNYIEIVRRAMRQVSWGHVEDWDKDKGWDYRYEEASFDPNRDMKRLAKDLAVLTIAGYRLYAGIARKLTSDRKALSQLMAEPGMVQVALKRSAAHVVPAALIYDYPFDPQAFPVDTTDYLLCKTFDAALRADAPLEECDCFKGKCWLKAEHDKTDEDLAADVGPYVCPSGFWGYRHALGFPLTIDNSDGNSKKKTATAPEEMIVHDAIKAVAGVSTEFDVPRRLKHEQVLQTLRQPTDWQRAETRMDVFRLLKKQKPHLVYFYCHGGVMGNKLPYIKVGQTDIIEPAHFLEDAPKWSDPRPLIFINGCHTTAVTPEVALSFVEFFVQEAQASGVIGTEITIFEPLARDFAEDCLRRFLGGQPFNAPVPIGEAIRGARLALLKRGNPLGLVYIPFVSASLHLVQQ